jgi:hypothetical protein
VRGIANGRVIDRAVAANRLPDAFSNSNAIIRRERLPPFGDLRRSFLASANNVELNQPGIATTRSENLPESSRYCSLQQIGMISEMRMPPLDINGEFYATISSGSRRTHEPSTRTAFVANRTYRRPPISAAIGPLPEVTPLDDRSLSYRKIYGSQTSGGSVSTPAGRLRDECGVNVRCCFRAF